MNARKGASAVLDLTSSASIALQPHSTSVDIFVDASVDVYLGFTATPGAANAPYKLKTGYGFNLTVNPLDSITLYFAPTTGSFVSGDRIRIQEWIA